MALFVTIIVCFGEMKAQSVAIQRDAQNPTYKEIHDEWTGEKKKGIFFVEDGGIIVQIESDVQTSSFLITVYCPYCNIIDNKVTIGRFNSSGSLIDKKEYFFKRKNDNKIYLDPMTIEDVNERKALVYSFLERYDISRIHGYTKYGVRCGKVANVVYGQYIYDWTDRYISFHNYIER